MLDSYGLSNLVINIFKRVEGDISEKEYKKELKTILFRKTFLPTPPER